MAYFFETRCRLWLAGGHGPQLMIIMKSTFIKRKFDKAAYALSADNVKEEQFESFRKKMFVERLCSKHRWQTVANVLRVFGGGGLARLIGRPNVLVLLSPIALSTKIGFTICLTYKLQTTPFNAERPNSAW